VLGEGKGRVGPDRSVPAMWLDGPSSTLGSRITALGIDKRRFE
jgi:hypothetical protein